MSPRSAGVGGGAQSVLAGSATRFPSLWRAAGEGEGWEGGEGGREAAREGGEGGSVVRHVAAWPTKGGLAAAYRGRRPKPMTQADGGGGSAGADGPSVGVVGMVPRPTKGWGREAWGGAGGHCSVVGSAYTVVKTPHPRGGKIQRRGRDRRSAIIECIRIQGKRHTVDASVRRSVPPIVRRGGPGWRSVLRAPQRRP